MLKKLKLLTYKINYKTIYYAHSNKSPYILSILKKLYIFSYILQNPVSSLKEKPKSDQIIYSHLLFFAKI